MRLRPTEVCPVHSSTLCCGSELLSKPKLIRLGVQRAEEPHHPVAISNGRPYGDRHLTALHRNQLPPLH